MATSTFAYKVRDSAGKVRSGTLDAETPAQVATKLRTMGYAPITIAEQKATGLQREITIPGFGSKKVGLKDLAVFSRQFATMINSGLSLLRAPLFPDPHADQGRHRGGGPLPDRPAPGPAAAAPDRPAPRDP